jgi:hypothetical protein
MRILIEKYRENKILILTSKNVHENFNARLREIDVRVGKWGENEKNILNSHHSHFTHTVRKRTK